MVSLSVCLSVCLFVCLSVCLSVCVFVCHSHWIFRLRASWEIYQISSGFFRFSMDPDLAGSYIQGSGLDSYLSRSDVGGSPDLNIRDSVHDYFASDVFFVTFLYPSHCCSIAWGRLCSHMLSHCPSVCIHSCGCNFDSQLGCQGSEIKLREMIIHFPPFLFFFFSVFFLFSL